MSEQSFYPEGEDLGKYISRRQTFGNTWQYIFLTALIIAIIVLIALLYNILNAAFGLVAVQTENDPTELVVNYNAAQMLGASNVISSEDDNVLASEINTYDDAIGFFGYAYYQENADQLKLLSVDGVLPSAETVGEYPLSRPLYIYTSAEALAANPSAAAFVSYYIDNVNSVIDEVGYFPVEESDLDNDRALIGEAAAASSVDGAVAIAGSSTVFPLTSALADGFMSESSATVSVESIGSTAGIRAFCNEGSIDIANASRPMTQSERVTCMANGREPIELLVGTDALAVVANPGNTFLTDVSLSQVQDIFSEKNFWDEIDGSYPPDPIVRTIPGADSGTLDFFAETAFGDADLESLDKEALVEMLGLFISTNRGRSLEREQRFFDDKLYFEDPELFAEICAGEEPPTGCVDSARSRADVLTLVQEEVVQPTVQESWSLVDSLTQREEIIAEASQKYPDAVVEFRSWLTPQFLVTPQSSQPDLAGVRTAIMGSLYVIFITIIFSFPIGVSAAIYMEEYASKELFINKVIQTNISNLAGVPSIIYGMLGLTVFVRVLEPITSGQIFGAVPEGTDPNSRTVVAAGLTLGLLILPIIIINAQEAIRAVPNSTRRASMGLGATKWQTIWNHVLPAALPGILTGTILAMSRAIGETAPLVVVGASTFVRSDPTFFSNFTVLPIQIYQWTARPQAEFQNIAAAAIIVLLVLLLTLNATAVILRNRFARR